MANKKTTSVKIAVIGAGVVGLAIAKSLIEKKFDVCIIDSDRRHVKRLKDEGLEAYLTTEEFAYGLADISMLCVPTPTINGAIELDYVKEACKSIAKAIAIKNSYHVIATRSTLLPGTNRNLILKTVEKYSGKKAGKDFGICMCPEFLREATALADARKPWSVIIGEFDERSGDTMEEVFKMFHAPIYRVSLEEAEAQKYIHNLYNATKISFFNEFREICKDLEVDADTVFKLTAQSCEGMWNPEYGTKDRGPFSGSCLPKDTSAFYAYAKTRGYSISMLEATIRVNEELKEV